MSLDHQTINHTSVHSATNYHCPVPSCRKIFLSIHELQVHWNEHSLLHLEELVHELKAEISLRQMHERAALMSASRCTQIQEEMNELKRQLAHLPQIQQILHMQQAMIIQQRQQLELLRTVLVDELLLPLYTNATAMNSSSSISASSNSSSSLSVANELNQHEDEQEPIQDDANENHHHHHSSSVISISNIPSLSTSISSMNISPPIPPEDRLSPLVKRELRPFTALPLPSPLTNLNMSNRLSPASSTSTLNPAATYGRSNANVPPHPVSDLDLLLMFPAGYTHKLLQIVQQQEQTIRSEKLLWPEVKQAIHSAWDYIKSLHAHERQVSVNLHQQLLIMEHQRCVDHHHHHRQHISVSHRINNNDPSKFWSCWLVPSQQKIIQSIASSSSPSSYVGRHFNIRESHNSSVPESSLQTSTSSTSSSSSSETSPSLSSFIYPRSSAMSPLSHRMRIESSFSNVLSSPYNPPPNSSPSSTQSLSPSAIERFMSSREMSTYLEKAPPEVVERLDINKFSRVSHNERVAMMRETLQVMDTDYKAHPERYNGIDLLKIKVLVVKSAANIVDESKDPRFQEALSIVRASQSSRLETTQSMPTNVETVAPSPLSSNPVPAVHERKGFFRKMFGDLIQKPFAYMSASSERKSSSPPSSSHLNFTFSETSTFVLSTPASTPSTPASTPSTPASAPTPINPVSTPPTASASPSIPAPAPRVIDNPFKPGQNIDFFRP